MSSVYLSWTILLFYFAFFLSCRWDWNVVGLGDVFALEAIIYSIYLSDKHRKQLLCKKKKKKKNILLTSKLPYCFFCDFEASRAFCILALRRTSPVGWYAILFRFCSGSCDVDVDGIAVNSSTLRFRSGRFTFLGVMVASSVPLVSSGGGWLLQVKANTSVNRPSLLLTTQADTTPAVPSGLSWEAIRVSWLSSGMKGRASLLYTKGESRARVEAFWEGPATGVRGGKQSGLDSSWPACLPGCGSSIPHGTKTRSERCVDSAMRATEFSIMGWLRVAVRWAWLVDAPIKRFWSTFLETEPISFATCATHWEEDVESSDGGTRILRLRSEPLITRAGGGWGPRRPATGRGLCGRGGTGQGTSTSSSG